MPIYRINPGHTGVRAVLDTGFGGGDGLAAVSGLDPIGFDLAAQPDGRIVVAGESLQSVSPVVVRLTPKGEVDGGFGSGTGVHLMVPDATMGTASSVAVMPDGGLAVSGVARIDGNPHPFVGRVTARGVPDQAMGPGGVRPLGHDDLGLDFPGVAVQPDGRIVTATTTQAGTGIAGVVYRLWGGLRPPACDGKRATIVGTRHPDHLVGTGRADVIAGQGGGDVIKGLGKGDVVCGGNGADTLSGGPGADTLLGGRGHDTLQGGPGHDTLQQ